MVPGDPRAISPSILEAVEQLKSEPTALGALRASRALHRVIVQWQPVLVREALTQGASWDHIGEALGSSRQAAWARFRHVTEALGTPSSMDERAELRKRLDQRRRTGQARLQEMDARWREDRSRLRDQLRDSQRQIREAAHQHASEKAAARTELRRTLDDLRTAISGEEPPPTQGRETDS